MSSSVGGVPSQAAVVAPTSDPILLCPVERLGRFPEMQKFVDLPVSADPATYQQGAAAAPL